MTTALKHLEVVAAIPNYNMADCLANLLPQVLRQGYDRVFVLDDASSDHSVDVVNQYRGAVTLLRSPQNRGAGANRNQIIGQVSDATTIHFIDADMDIATDESASVARELIAKYAAIGGGAIGGLVRRPDGLQEKYNYGPVFSLRTHLTSEVPPLLNQLRSRPVLGRPLANVGRSAVHRIPDVFGTPVPVQTYWVHEGNMLISAGDFRAVGGYDATLREHEAQDLAIALHKIGVNRYFDPRIEVIHHEVDVRGKFRGKRQAEAALRIVRKHGLRRYLMD